MKTSAKCHQRIIREERAATAADANLFGAWWDALDLSRRAAIVRRVDYVTAADIILSYEWLGTMPTGLRAAYGLFCDGHMAAVECFTDSKAGSFYSLFGKRAVCLARGACTHWAPDWSSSFLIRQSMRRLSTSEYEYVMAYSDTDAGEIGTVYQAAGWTCTGAIPNIFWEAPGGQRFDQRHHRDRAKVRHADGSYRVVGDEHLVQREKMLAEGWEYKTGGTRYRYAASLGSRLQRRGRDKLLREHAVQYPKRAEAGT